MEESARGDWERVAPGKKVGSSLPGGGWVEAKQATSHSKTEHGEASLEALITSQRNVIT